ncbi:hypothetical protein [Pyrobaculum aerophilum]|nr:MULTISPECIES: hypothetical protein [Pyrobaculum]HII47461.1 hypothetical protein [Pyrobaculum aerophilum]
MFKHCRKCYFRTRYRNLKDGTEDEEAEEGLLFTLPWVPASFNATISYALCGRQQPYIKASLATGFLPFLNNVPDPGDITT